MSSNDYQLLFGVLALQLEIITVEQFAEACTVWATKKERPLPELLSDRGWLHNQDRTDIERLLHRKISRHDGDVSATLREAAHDPRVHASLASIDNYEVTKSLSPTPGPNGKAAAPTRMFLPPTSSDRYRLSRLHATGGIGRVWLAHDESLRREVALKELRPERAASETVQSRFLREARITGQLEHPGIVPIYEVGLRPDDQAPYYTMRFIKGQTLAEAADEYHRKRRKDQAGPRELRRLLAAFVGVCNAVAYAHSRGVLHRDLKPQNVVLGAFGEVVVLDWGLAKVAGESDDGPAPLDLGSMDGADETTQGQAVGTPSYMSPEQAEGRHDLLNQTTDVYGLGAVLYHLLTGQPPFPATSHTEAINKVIKEPPKPPREVWSEAPAALEAVCLKAISKTQRERYQTSSELAEEVQRWLADEPVKAFEEPLMVRAGRWLRRHKTFVSAAAVFLVCASLATGGAAVMFYREQQAAKREQEATQQAKDATEREKKLVEESLRLVQVEREATRRHLDRTFRLVEYVLEQSDKGLYTSEVIPIRMALIQRAVDTINEIDRERPGDPKVVAVAASVQKFQANTESQQDGEKAQRTLKGAIDALEPVARLHPKDESLQSQLAQLYVTIGTLCRRQGKRQEAIGFHEKAVDVTKRLAENGTEAGLFNHGTASDDLAQDLFGFKPMEETERASAAAGRVFEGLIKGKLTDQTLVYRLYYLRGQMRIADCRRERGRPKEALETLNAVRAVLDEIGNSYPARPDVIQFRGLYHLCRARSLASIPDRSTDALKEYALAIATWEGSGLARTDRTWVALGTAYGHRAELQRRLGKTADAELDLERADKALAPLLLRGAKSIEYLSAQALASACRARIAHGKKDREAAAKHLESARNALQAILNIDSDNELERKAFQDLQTFLRS